MKTVFLFPGQGSQFAGMGAEHFRKQPAVQETIAQIEDLSGVALKKTMLSGPRRVLQGTHIAQLAIFALSMAVLKALRAHDIPAPAAMCGHSLGQFSALVAAGALSLEAGTKVVDLRGRLMDAQNQNHDGSMIAVSGITKPELIKHLAGVTDAWLANDNAPGQLIVSGARHALETLQTNLKAQGISCTALDVAGAYHSPLIAPAAEEFAEYIAQLEIQEPDCPVIANTDASVLLTADQIRDELSKHMLSAVHWRATMDQVPALGIQHGVEVGGGRTMKGLWLRNHPDLTCSTTNDQRDMAQTLKMLSGFGEPVDMAT